MTSTLCSEAARSKEEHNNSDGRYILHISIVNQKNKCLHCNRDESTSHVDVSVILPERVTAYTKKHSFYRSTGILNYNKCLMHIHYNSLARIVLNSMPLHAHTSLLSILAHTLLLSILTYTSLLSILAYTLTQKDTESTEMRFNQRVY